MTALSLSILIFGLFIRELFCYVTTCEPVVSIPKPPIVKIPNFGVFQGSATQSLIRERIIYQFLGIPYALPPLGPWRFKPPVALPVLNTDIIYNATSFKKPCPQLITDEDYQYLRKNSDSAEDCLYLNVYTVTIKGDSAENKLPVMVYIHGGGYYQNSALGHCPNYLLDHDMILVTLQYRLGPFGFLNLDVENVAGNMGLLDTLEAIKWVNKNIKYFGGDNERITIAGQSSGAVSVSLMLVTPLVKHGLFQQAIIQSGNFMGDWSLDMNSKEHAIQLAKYVNCTQIEISELVKCLVNVSSYDIIDANHRYMHDRIILTKNDIREIGINHVVIQNAGPRRFITQNPIDSLRNGNFLKMPILTGVTKDEGTMVIEDFVDVVIHPTYRKLFITSENESAYLNGDFFYDVIKFLGVQDDNNRIELTKDYYLPDNVCIDFNHTVPGLVDLIGALFMKSVVLRFARYMAPYAPTYLYSFNFKGRKTKLGYGKTLKHIYLNGVAHSDELLYLFPDARDFSLTKNEKKVVQYMSGLWSSFIISGNNSVSSSDLLQWPPMSSVVGPYLQISQKLKIKQNFINEYRNYIVRQYAKTDTSSDTKLIETWLPVLLLLAFFVLSDTR